LPVWPNKMKYQAFNQNLELEDRISRRPRNQLKFDDLSNLILRSGSSMMSTLSDVKHQLIFTVDNTGQLIPAVYESETQLQTRRVQFMKARPALCIDFPQRNEEERRKLFAQPRLVDYLGNDREVLVKIARSGELKCKYRMQTLIDAVDDEIACYLGRNLYSTSLEKRPRINLNQLEELWNIIPLPIIHLANVLSFGSSLILHRRSQRLNSMNRSSLSRIERLFYFHPLISDGQYPFSFEPEKVEEFIDFLMKEAPGPNAILKDALMKAQFEQLRKKFDQNRTTFVQPVRNRGFTVEENLNEFDRKKFNSEKKDHSNLGHIIMPGNLKQKAFLREEWAKIKTWTVPSLKVLMTPNRINTIPEPGSRGFLSKIGRLRVKSNLRILFKYYTFVQHRCTTNPLCGYWLHEREETINSIHVNILIWQTNSIIPLID